MTLKQHLKLQKDIKLKGDKMTIKTRLLEGILIAGGLVGSVYTGVNRVIEQYGKYNCENKRAEITNELVEKGLARDLNEKELYSMCEQIRSCQNLEEEYASNILDYSELAVPFFGSLVVGALLNKRRRARKSFRNV